MKPLLDTHPEFSVVLPAPGVIEFKVENWTLRSGRERNSRDGVADLILIACFVWAWFKLSHGSIAHLFVWISIASLYLYFKCTRILYESITLLPLHGIQLETHRGVKPPFLSALPLAASRRFIPLTSVRDVVINEGLRRWDVRYYICIIRDIGSEVTLEVAFENILPHLAVLEVVYNHIQDLLRDSNPAT